MKKAVISVSAVLAIFLTFSFGFAQTFSAPAGVSGHVQQKLQAPLPPSARLEQIFGQLEHETIVMPWGSSLSRIAVLMGREGQKGINEFVDEVVELNKNNPCLKTRDLVWEGCDVKIPAYPSREVQIRFAAANVVSDSQDAAIRRLETKLALAKGAKKQNTLTLGIMATIILALLAVIALLSAKHHNAKQDLNHKREKNKRLSENLFDTAELLLAKDNKIKSLENKLVFAEDANRIHREATERIVADRVASTKAENEKLIETVSKLYAEKDTTRVNLAEVQAILEKYAMCAEGAPYSFESRDNGMIPGAYKVKKSHVGLDGKPVIDALECTLCSAEVLPKMSNCNSHYWGNHG